MAPETTVPPRSATPVPTPSVPMLPVGTSWRVVTKGGGVPQAAVPNDRGIASITLTSLRVFEEAGRRRAYIDGYISVVRLYGNVGADVFAVGLGEVAITPGDEPGKKQTHPVIRVEGDNGKALLPYLGVGRQPLHLVIDGGIPQDLGPSPKYRVEVRLPGMDQPLEGWLAP